MGGSGGGAPYTDRDIRVLREEAAEGAEQARIDSEVNSLLNEELLEINDRDTDAINDRLDQIRDALGDAIEDFESLLFGGSIAKRTWVNGLSDVDSVVIMDVGDRRPDEVKELLEKTIRERVPQGEIREVSVGNMAVTVTYRDGTQIQLLPAARRGEELVVPTADGQQWAAIEPRRFSKELTDVNQQQGNSVVPAVKLAKTAFANRLGDDSPSGYHVEALAVAAFADYAGPRNPKAMVTHLVESAATNVLRPVHDVTGQSAHIDELLGEANSHTRRELARRLSAIARTMRDSRSLADWRDLLGG